MLGYNASMLSTSTSIGFIGAGNMATALVEGLLATGVAASQLWAADTDVAKAVDTSTKAIAERFGVTAAVIKRVIREIKNG